MRVQLIFASLMLLFFCQSAQPADSVIKNAELDIARYEKQAEGLTASRKNNIKRIQKLMKLSMNRLAGSSNKDHPSWVEVNRRYQVLDEQLNNLLTDKPVAAQQTQTVESNQASTISQSGQTSAPALVSGQRVRVKKLARDIDSVANGIKTQGPSALQDPGRVASLKKLYDQFKQALARYPQVDDPDVKTAQSSFKSLQVKLNAEFERAKSQLKILGDVQKRLAEIAARQHQYPAPAALSIPFNEAAAKQWVEASSNARTVSEHDHKQLTEIQPLAWLPNNPGTPQTGASYDANDVKRLKENSVNNFNRVQRTYQQMNEIFKQRIQAVYDQLNTRWKQDPNGDKSWIFTSESSMQEAYEFFRQSSRIADSYVFLESALKRDVQFGIEAKNAIKDARNAFDQNRLDAIDSARLPEAKSTDSNRITIAQQILDNPKYKFGEYGPIVLTTEAIVEREKQSSEIEIDDAEFTSSGDLKLSGTETTWSYRWQEFKFAVPLKSDDQKTWHVWWIVAKNFSSGGDNTPLNRWISGRATQGNPILKKNF